MELRRVSVKPRVHVMSGTQYHSTGSWDSEGHWLQLMCCAYLLAVSRYFGYTEDDLGSWEYLEYGFQNLREDVSVGTDFKLEYKYLEVRSSWNRV